MSMKEINGYSSLQSQGIEITPDAEENTRKIGNRPITNDGLNRTAQAVAALSGAKVSPNQEPVVGDTQKQLVDLENSNSRGYRMTVVEYTGPRLEACKTEKGGIDFEALTAHLSLVDKEADAAVTFDINRDRIVSNPSEGPSFNK